MGLKENLKMLRKAKGLKQSELAEILNKKTLTIGRYETGVINPPLPVLKELSEFYGLHTDYLTEEIPYEKGRKYSVQEIRELAAKTLMEKFTKDFPLEKESDEPIQTKLNFNNIFDKSVKTQQDNSPESEKAFFNVFTHLGNIFIRNDYNLTEKEKVEILENLKVFIDFAVSEKKRKK